MLTSYDNLPLNAKVWVLLPDHQLQENELDQITDVLRTFLKSWETHGKPVNASLKLEFQQILVIAVDTASGCSVDKLMNLILEIDQIFNAGFFNRTAVRLLNKENILSFLALKTFKDSISYFSDLDSHSTFNTNVTTKEELQKEWIIPLKNSWLNRYVQTLHK